MVTHQDGKKYSHRLEEFPWFIGRYCLITLRNQCQPNQVTNLMCQPVSTIWNYALQTFSRLHHISLSLTPSGWLFVESGEDEVHHILPASHVSPLLCENIQSFPQHPWSIRVWHSGWAPSEWDWRWICHLPHHVSQIPGTVFQRNISHEFIKINSRHFPKKNSTSRIT